MCYTEKGREAGPTAGKLEHFELVFSQQCPLQECMLQGRNPIRALTVGLRYHASGMVEIACSKAISSIRHG